MRKPQVQCRLSILIFGISLLLSFPGIAHALISIQLEPIVGYERTQQLLPTAHTVNRLIYGARATVGVPLISAEAEYTHGSLQEEFPSLSQTSLSDRVKLGLRSGYQIGSFLTFALRGGVQASQTQTQQTVGGVTTTTYDPLRYDPYAGTTLQVRLSSKMYASASVVAVIRDIQNLDQSEYQATAGFSIRLP